MRGGRLRGQDGHDGNGVVFADHPAGVLGECQAGISHLASAAPPAQLIGQFRQLTAPGGPDRVALLAGRRRGNRERPAVDTSDR